MKLYTVWDSQLEFYTKPMMFRNAAEALRSFEEAVNDDTVLGKVAEHITLFEIGDFYEESGRIVSYDAYKALARGHELKKKKAPDFGQGKLELAGSSPQQ